MGFYIVPDINSVQLTDEQKESQSEFIADPGCVMVGRWHSGDENGPSQMKFAKLIVDPNAATTATITLVNQQWTVGQKQSVLNYQAPSGWAIIGRKHSGDENGDTSFLIAQVLVSGQTVRTTDSTMSGEIKESSGIWYTSPNWGTLMQSLTMSTHSGDENGNSTYGSSLFYYSGTAE